MKPRAIPLETVDHKDHILTFRVDGHISGGPLKSQSGSV